MEDLRMQSIAEDILRLSRNTLLVNLRFLDIALSQLKWRPYNPYNCGLQVETRRE